MAPKTGLLAALSCLGVFFAPQAVADAGDDCRPADIEFLTASGMHDEPDRAREERCRKSPDYQYVAGRLLNGLQRYPEAAERLELALMLRPDHWPSRMEFLIALRGNGDLLSARALLASLRDDGAIPADVRAALPERLDPPLPVLGGAPRLVLRTGRIGLTAGYDSNLMMVPTVRNFDLTLGGSRIPVALTNDNLPRGGHFWRLDASGQMILNSSHTGRFWLGGLSAILRHAPGNSNADYAAIEGRIENVPLRSGGYFQGSLLTAVNRDRAFYRQGAIEFGRDQEIRDSGRLRLGLEVQHRSYPQTPALDGRYQGALLRYADNGWRAELRLGRDLARTERAGGDQDRYGLVLNRDFRTRYGRWLVGYERESLRDREGYSPLLESNRQRRMDKNIYRVEYAVPYRDLEFFAGAEFVRQKSNLPLFVTRSNAFYAGLRSLF